MSSLHTSTLVGAGAVIVGSFLGGTILSINLLTLPVLYSTTTSPTQLLHQWDAIYHNGHRKGPAIAVATSLAYVYQAYTQAVAEARWELPSLAAGLTIGMIPYTWIFMLGTNDKLFALLEEARGGRESAWSEAQKLVRKWDFFNVVRAWFPLAGAVVGILSVCGVRLR